MKASELKEVLRGLLLFVFGVGFAIIFTKIGLYGHHVALEPNPYILTIELLMSALAIVLGLEILVKVGKSLSESLSKRLRGK